MADEEKPKFEVGYARPPKATRFRPGQSGNPKGRRKAAKNFATAINKELNARVPITENGKRKSISKREAVAKQLVNKAASGDPKAIPVLLAQSRQHEDASRDGSARDVLDGAQDQQVIAGILDRMRRTFTEQPSEDVNEGELESPTNEGDGHDSDNR